jgi:hypothetical protein
LLQPFKDSGKVDLSFTERNFFAQVAWIVAEQTVFRMNSAHVVAKRIHGIDRISLSLKNQIGQIKVYVDVVQAYVLNQSQESDGRFLSSLA